MSVYLPCGPCVLRSWRPTDLDSLVHHANNRNVWITLRDRFPHPYTVEAGKAWLSFSAAEDPPTSLTIDVEGTAVGGIGVVLGLDVHSHSGEIGYWLGEAYWGRGIASAAVQGFVPWAAQTFGLTRFFAEVFETNASSMRVLEKSGFVREGLLRHQVRKDGRYLDQAVYGLVLHDSSHH